MDSLGGLVDTRYALYPPYIFWFRLGRLGGQKFTIAFNRHDTNVANEKGLE